MYKLYNIKDLIAFKIRLNESRNEKNFTQESFAEKIGASRTSIINWENCKGNENGKKNTNTLPTLSSFTKICEVLEMEPNYLLGVSEIKSQNDYEISKATGLSIENIKLLKENKYCNGLIDYFLSCDEASNIIERIKKICYLEYISQALETSFSKNICDKINKAFTKFSEEIFPLDMTKNKFIDYLRKEIVLKSNEYIDSFIKESIAESEFNNVIVNIFSDFNSHTKDEKYNILIEYIADCSYEYKMSSSNIELSKYKISTSIFNILDKYIESTVTDFKKANKSL